MKHKFWLAAGGVVVALALYNSLVFLPVAHALRGEDKLTAVAYRNLLLDPNSVVFDIWNVRPDGAMVDVDRALFEAAEGLKGQHFKSVILAFRGRGRFKLDGDQFQTIGEERSFQNPIYVVRTLPEFISKMDGTPAFETFTGGFLGVMLKEMQEHEELHFRWYLLAMAGRDPEGPLPPSIPDDQP